MATGESFPNLNPLPSVRDLTAEERDEFEGYVRANKFVATLRREAQTMKSGAAL